MTRIGSFHVVAHDWIASLSTHLILCLVVLGMGMACGGTSFSTPSEIASRATTIATPANPDRPPLPGQGGPPPPTANDAGTLNPICTFSLAMRLVSCVADASAEGKTLFWLVGNENLQLQGREVQFIPFEASPTYPIHLESCDAVGVNCIIVALTVDTSQLPPRPVGEGQKAPVITRTVPPPVVNTPSADHGADTLAITCTTNAQQRTVTCELHGAAVGSELNWQVNNGDIVGTGPLFSFVVPALRPDLPVLVDACRSTGTNSYDCQTVETTVDTSHLPPKPPGDPPPGTIVEGPSAWDRSSCVEPPGTKHAGSDFVYDGRVVADSLRQDCVAFEPGSGDYKKVCTPDGCFRVQTLANQWPDGEVVWLEDAGENGYTFSPYYGYRQHVQPDTIDFASLDATGQVARWAAAGVVHVIGDRCFIGTEGTADDSSATNSMAGVVQEWLLTTLPLTGFFIADNLVLTHTAALGSVNTPDESGLYGSEIISHSQDCEQLRAGYTDPNLRAETGAGPFIQLMDGTWASGQVVSQGDVLSIIQVNRFSPHGNSLVSTWQPWDAHTGHIAVLPLDRGSSGVDSQDDVVTIHHPIRGRGAGGWHVTTGHRATECDQLDLQVANSGTRALALNFYTDQGSQGAPLLNSKGLVIGVIADTWGQDPARCNGDIHRGMNTLGILSSFLADPPETSLAVPTSYFYSEAERVVAGLDKSMTTSPTISDQTVWPRNALTQNNARIEITDWGSEFTASGFPVKHLDSPAFDFAKQATVMFARQTGCPNCAADMRSIDFSIGCVCTGFAVTNDLIVTNNHCVSAMAIGDKATFRTYYGQDVEATLIGKSMIDGERSLMDGRTIDIVDSDLGDVALLRTTERMDLSPARLANSDTVDQYTPILSVGHPGIMSRSGPYVVSAGSVIGHSTFYEPDLFYSLPVWKGSSGSGVFNLNGEIIGQVAAGGLYAGAEQESILKTKYNKQAIEIATEAWGQNLGPKPFDISHYVEISQGLHSSGASSNYIRQLIELWAPGELPA